MRPAMPSTINALLVQQAGNGPHSLPLPVRLPDASDGRLFGRVLDQQTGHANTVDRASTFSLA